MRNLRHEASDKLSQQVYSDMQSFEERKTEMDGSNRRLCWLAQQIRVLLLQRDKVGHAQERESGVTLNGFQSQICSGVNLIH